MSNSSVSTLVLGISQMSIARGPKKCYTPWDMSIIVCMQIFDLP
jgi:hypothetical protein